MASKVCRISWTVYKSEQAEQFPHRLHLHFVSHELVFLGHHTSHGAPTGPLLGRMVTDETLEGIAVDEGIKLLLGELEGWSVSSH